MGWMRTTALIFSALLFAGTPEAARSAPVFSGPPPAPPMPAELELDYLFAVGSPSGGELRIIGHGTLPLEIPGAGSFSGQGDIAYRLELPRQLTGCTHNFPKTVRYSLTGVREPASPVDKLPVDLTSHPPAVFPRISCPDGGGFGPLPYSGGTGRIELRFADGDTRSIVPPEGIPGATIQGKVTLHLACPVPAGGGSVRLEFRPETPPVSEEESRSKAEIDRLTQSSRRRVPLLGLTRPKPPLPPETLFAPVFTPAKTGRGWCLEVEMGIIFPDVEMLIPREYASKPCNYRVTKEHETEHYQAYLGLVRTAQGKIRQTLEQARVPSKARPIYVRSEAEKDAYKDAWVSFIKDGLLAPIYGQLGKDFKAANDRLDTLQVHALVVAQCPSW